MANTDFLTKPEQQQIVQAIENAELNTSGEIRVHIESLCKGDPVARAVKVFEALKMHKTEQRNAVLIYIAHKSHKFAIIGDSGINEKVPDDFWDSEKELLLNHLKEGNPCEGLVSIINLAGEKLKEFFPYQTDDINEHSNEISFGD